MTEPEEGSWGTLTPAWVPRGGRLVGLSPAPRGVCWLPGESGLSSSAGHSARVGLLAAGVEENSTDLVSVKGTTYLFLLHREIVKLHCVSTKRFPFYNPPFPGGEVTPGSQTVTCTH